jgi:DNA-binding NarL/FixJ family response regulator
MLDTEINRLFNDVFTRVTAIERRLDSLSIEQMKKNIAKDLGLNVTQLDCLRLFKAGAKGHEVAERLHRTDTMVSLIKRELKQKGLLR